MPKEKHVVKDHLYPFRTHMQKGQVQVSLCVIHCSLLVKAVLDRSYNVTMYSKSYFLQTGVNSGLSAALSNENVTGSQNAGIKTILVKSKHISKVPDNSRLMEY